MQAVLERIIEWANAESPVRAAILLGSRGAGIGDEYSDYDLAIFTTTVDPYIKEDKWLSLMGNVWVCVKEKVVWKGKEFPTRLVIFEGGTKVDFAFYTLDVLEEIVQKRTLPEEYQRGYVVVVDKGSLAVSLSKANLRDGPAIKPSREEFKRVIEEFWFEVYHIAKYLQRGDLWSAKFRASGIQDQFLLQMISWHAEANGDWKGKVPPKGKRMQTWVDPAIWKALHNVFAHFESEDSWECLQHTMNLFREMAMDTAHRLGYDYPEALDKNISGYLNNLRRA